MIAFRCGNGGNGQVNNNTASYTAQVGDELIKTNAAFMFDNGTPPQEDIIIGNNIINCAYMFRNCSTFNQNVSIGRNVTDCVGMFLSCGQFNTPITIPSNVASTAYMFHNCSNFCSDVEIKGSLNCARMFEYCSDFDANVKINDNVIDCNGMFNACIRLNKIVNIPSKAENIIEMFRNCREYHASNIVIPKNVKSCQYVFINCSNIEGNIYINNANITSVAAMLQGKNVSKRINVFCNNIRAINASNSYSIVGSSIVWTATSNGYYNQSYNIYLYNNYIGT